MKEFTYIITEQNIDGCGTDVTEHIKFQSEKPLNNKQKTSFQNTLRTVKAKTQGACLSTTDMILDALYIFEKDCGIHGELCMPPSHGTFTF